ncbi:MAG: DUF3048 domain-containing protein [Bacilli bacterium]|nr:DUF3048 domain-containing protein [Bacilli bacterium]
MLSSKKKIVLVSVGAIILGILIFLGYSFVMSKNKVVDDNKEVPKKVEEKKEEEEQPDYSLFDLESDERSIAFMIDNHLDARPQVGLQKAYMVYEVIVEGGMTRMMALFKDQNDVVVGPIRSSRHYFLDYAFDNDAVYVHFGFSPQASNDIIKFGVNNINGISSDGGLFWRDNSIAAPHNAFTNVNSVKNRLPNKKYRVTTDKGMLLNYSKEPLELNNDDSKVVNSVKVQYSKSYSVKYSYDSKNKVYNRYIGNLPHYDRVTKEQYTAKNIIVYNVKNYNIGDGTARQQLETVGSGTGYYISEGYAVPITWVKSSRSAKTIYKDTSGNPLTVNYGNTFIHIQPTYYKPIIE